MAPTPIWDRLLNFLSGKKVHKNSPPPYLLKYRSSKTFIITTVCIAVFTDIFLYGIIVPVLPYSLSSRANIPISNVQHWVSILLAIYAAAICIGAPITGYYADQTSSRRFPLLLGLGVLAAATVMLCLARSIALLVVGRILQGFSAAVVWTVGQALLVDTVGERDIGQTAGWVSMAMSGGVLVAPLLGGVVYERVGYYAVFYMAFGLVALDIVLRLALVEKKIARQWDEGIEDEEEEVEVEGDEEKRDSSTTPSQDLLQTHDKILAEPPVTGEIPEESDETSPTENTGEGTPAIYSKLPPIVQLLGSKRLLAALWGTIVQGSLMTAFDAVLPLFVQNTFHWTSTNAGLIFLAVYLPMFVAPVVGYLSDRFGPRWLVFAGFLLAVPPLICLRFITYNSSSQKVLLCALLAIIGVSLTFAMTPLMAEITYVVEAKEKKNPGIYGATGAYGQAYALFIMAWATGGVVGPLWAGFVEKSGGWGTMAWSLAVLGAAGAVPALTFTGGFIGHENAKSGDERAKTTAPLVANELQNAV